MLDDNYSISGVDKFLKHFGQAVDICRVKAGGRLIENIYSLACSRARKLGRKFYSLCLTA